MALLLVLLHNRACGHLFGARTIAAGSLGILLYMKSSKLLVRVRANKARTAPESFHRWKAQKEIASSLLDLARVTPGIKAVTALGVAMKD
jgi:hypothetical protein